MKTMRVLILYQQCSELDEALLCLPFGNVITVLPHLDAWIKTGQAVERSTHCLLFLMQVRWSILC